MHETGKQRRARIEHGYYRRLDPIARRRRGVVALVVLLTLGWLALAPWWGHGRRTPALFRWKHLASPGELTRSHAMWEARCEACHVPMTPVNGWRWSPLNRGSRASDQLCLGCHAAGDHPGTPGRAAPHAAEVAACAECHRDHQGRDASLVRLDDSACTRCHADLDAHRQGQATAEPRVTGFPAGHPTFAERDDTGTIAFHHARHLAPGMPAPQGGPVLSYAQLAPEDRVRYGGKAQMTAAELAEPVRLECASCHRLDADGSRMLPLSYENDCRSCHPLGYDPRLPERVAPHGVQPSAVVEALRSTYRAEAAVGDAAILARPLPARPLPGRDDAAAAADEPAGRLVEEKVAAAVRKLFVAAAEGDGAGARADRGGCRLCHAIPAGPVEQARVEPPGPWFAPAGRADDPPAWFPRARFRHEAHRYLECAQCHDGVNTSQSNKDLHIPDMATCARCHHSGGSPLAWRGAEGDGAAADCTLCHRYHARPPGGGASGGGASR